MPFYKANLHNHSCLSPCASLQMSPDVIVKAAREHEINILALSDHNSALNTPAFHEHCRDYGILPISGLEVTSREEAHMLCLFSDPKTALDFGEWIKSIYIAPPNDPEKWGDQVYVDKENNILGEVELALTQGAVSASMEELNQKTHDFGGLFIPAHIDRPVYSVASQLGFLPPDSYDAVEVTQKPPGIPTGKNTLIASSDSHYPEDLGKRHTLIEMDSLDFSSLKTALKAGKTEIFIW